MSPVLLTLVLLGLGLVIGSAVRLALPARWRLSWPAAVLAGVAGSGTAGAAVATVSDRWLPAILAAVAGTLVVSLLAARVGRRLRTPAPVADEVPSLDALLAAGETEKVEFKSTARRNLHTGERDERLELVIVKTVAGFLNGSGGTLLIGVSDDGAVVGLEPDYALLKAPDDDRYELWLRDLLTTCLGGPATALVRVSFHDLRGKRVCRVDMPSAPAPVFLNPPKGQPASEFWVRMGNSTRRLLTHEVLEYHRHRWP
jgi:hypothetical protein